MAVFLGPGYLRKSVEEHIGEGKNGRPLISPGTGIAGGIWKPAEDYYAVSVDFSLDEDYSEENRLGTVYRRIRRASSEGPAALANACSDVISQRLDPSFRAMEERMSGDGYVEAQEILADGRATCNEYALLSAAMLEESCRDFLPGTATINGTVIVDDFEQAKDILGEEEAADIGKDVIEEEPDFRTSTGEGALGAHLWAEYVGSRRYVVDAVFGNAGRPDDFKVYSNYLSGFSW